jgi:hypothetical protein
MSIDTLSYVKRLESAGVPRAQAEAHAEAMREEIVPQVASETSIAGIRKDMGAEFVAVRKEVAAGFATVATEFVAVRKEMAAEFVAVRKEMASEAALIRKDMETHAQRIESLIWRAAFAILGGGLAVGGFLIRFMK